MSVVDGLRELPPKTGMGYSEQGQRYSRMRDLWPLLLDVVEAAEEPASRTITGGHGVTQPAYPTLREALATLKSAFGGAKRPPCPRGVLEHALYPCSCKPNEDYGKPAQGAEQRLETGAGA